MNIVYIVSDGLNEFNSSNFRVAVPSDALRRAGHDVHIINVKQWMKKTDEIKRICSAADIIHLQRVLTTDTHPFIQYWRSIGKAVVADWDDAYRLIGTENAASDFWYHGKVKVKLEYNIEYEHKLIEHPIEQFKKGLKICTAGITPSKVLSESWQTDVPTFVVPNYLKSSLYHAAKKQDNSPYVVVAWGGSLSHTPGWRNSGIQEAFRRILQERDYVRLLIIGDKRVVDELPLRKDRVMFRHYTPWWIWQQTLKRYDIGLAPLAGEYDDRRSSLKVAEYLLAGIPFIASNSPVYSDFTEADSGIFVKHDDYPYDERVEDWYQSTIEMLDKLDYYNENAQKNIEEIGMTYDVDRNVDAIIAVYEEIIELER
jgi:glycosyltransferase involved in cell wall biosynthesis